MQQIKTGDVSITSIIERDGPWRKPEDMFPVDTMELGQKYLADGDRFHYRFVRS